MDEKIKLSDLQAKLRSSSLRLEEVLEVFERHPKFANKFADLEEKVKNSLKSSEVLANKLALEKTLLGG